MTEAQCEDCGKRIILEGRARLYLVWIAGIIYDKHMNDREKVQSLKGYKPIVRIMDARAGRDDFGIEQSGNPG